MHAPESTQIPSVCLHTPGRELGFQVQCHPPKASRAQGKEFGIRGDPLRAVSTPVHIFTGDRDALITGAYYLGTNIGLHTLHGIKRAAPCSFVP